MDPPQQDPASVHSMVQKALALMNSPSLLSPKQAMELAFYIELLANRTVGLSIWPLGRRLCRLCDAALGENGPLTALNCDCLYSLHPDCYARAGGQLIYSGEGGIMRCRGCHKAVRPETRPAEK